MQQFLTRYRTAISLHDDQRCAVAQSHRQDGRHGLGSVRSLGRSLLMCGTAVVLCLAVTGGDALAESAKEKQLEKRIENLEGLVKSLSDELRATRKDAKEAKEQAAKIPPKVTKSGKKGVSLTVSGQVNRGVLISDDGEQTEMYHVDNDHSSTRVRFVGKGKVNKDFEIGGQIEVQIESNSTSTVNQVTKSTPDAGFTERKLEVFFKHKKFGNVWVGQGDTASNSVAELDLTGTNLIIKSAANEFAGGQIWRENNPPAVGTTNQTMLLSSRAQDRIRDTINNYDGLSRRDRLRYDTPTFYGFTASTSVMGEGTVDAALRYKGKFGPVKTVAAYGWAHDAQGGNNRNTHSGSVSALHTPTGLGLTGASGCRNAWGKDRGCARNWYWYIKGGWQWDIFNIGRSFVGIDYYAGNGIRQRGDRSRAFGLGIIQKIDAVATEIYFGVRNHSLDRDPAGDPTTNFDFSDNLSFLTGARIKF